MSDHVRAREPDGPETIVGSDAGQVRARESESTEDKDLRPSTSDRTENGRFAKGNKAAVGNPHASRVAKLRTAYLEECTEEKMRALVRSMLALAADGDVAAAREVCNRVFGQEVFAKIEHTGGELNVVFSKDWCGNDAHDRIAGMAAASAADPE